MHTADTALAYARRAHARQRDKAGLPYIGHVERVVAHVRRLLAGLRPGLLSAAEEDEILQAAALHDAAEDEAETGVSHDDLERDGFSAGVRRRVRRLDKRFKVGGYQDNIEAMAAEGDIGVIMVKLGDNLDNGDPARIAALPPEERSIARRYARARTVLEGAYATHASAPGPSA